MIANSEDKCNQMRRFTRKNEWGLLQFPEMVRTDSQRGESVLTVSWIWIDSRGGAAFGTLQSFLGASFCESFLWTNRQLPSKLACMGCLVQVRLKK